MEVTCPTLHQNFAENYLDPVFAKKGRDWYQEAFVVDEQKEFFVLNRLDLFGIGETCSNTDEA